ncbi:uncharacterized protein SPAPADRAFT_138145 [Spathaspora passalidarum NRRL Y-27907]|uniref:Uncharacterized protein n=1 Tax=Spathaspora passalidarum (strain NRRL Y-27907 / 11-Y1) TaxID=619300 RepID=G3AMY4_SPAPN|nr:uncharacterized protein SPAPADRAFT_138145 [Spathaspora passalidarum NRRL Y-27907]EGW32398.1 hypothetical protein SPAPADRAFT_138145 [Spathaspora passalidarum NRRL Y-27907]
MEDSRDEVINSDDLLTEDSADELKDLVKEFEAKYEALKQQKELNKQKKQDKVNRTEVPKSPPPKPTNHTLVAPPIPKMTPRIETVVIESKPKEKAKSNFLNKLYDANFQVQLRQIDYDKRRFEFALSEFKSEAFDVDEKEPITGHFLRKRFISANQFQELIKATDPEMKFLKIDKLLAKVNKANNFAEPVYTNWCLVGMVLAKSEPKMTKINTKYMKLKVGNFHHSVDLMLFEQAFEKNWKIQPGNLIAVLNPIVSKYEIEKKFGFNLKLDNSNVSSIVEIGALRDFGYCKFVKPPNIKCQNVINPKEAELCDIHLDMKYKHSGRMELNGAVQMRSPKKFKKTNESGSYFRDYNEDTVITSGGAAPDFKRFQDPKVLQTQNKRRKLLDQRANEKLEKKLSKLSSNSSLNNLNLIKGDNIIPKPLEKVRTQGFPNSMISQIGYDPTSTPNDLKTPAQRMKENSRLQELYELSMKNSKSKSLTTSKQDQQLKVDKWKSNIKSLKDYDKKVVSKPLNLSQPLTGLTKGRPNMVHVKNKHNRVVLDDDDDDVDDDDDDIDIQFGNDKIKNQYLKLVENRKA